jgi:hypothetical protein
MSGDDKEILLRELAYTMMRRQVRDLDRGEVLARIQPQLRRVSTPMTGEQFLIDAQSNGVFIEREANVYTFAHHTLQEYLAAAHIREQGLAFALTTTVDQEWWRETTLLYVARSDADPIVKACLKSGTLDALALAFDCADQGSQLAPALRSHLAALLESAFDPATDIQRRRLMVRVLVARRLRGVIQTADGGRICVNPIDTGTYRLFEQMAREQPLEATGPTPHATASPDREAAIGTWAQDAVELVAWLNTLTVGGREYRLPDTGQLADPAVLRLLAASPQRRDQSFWALNSDVLGSGRPVLWTAPGVSNPRAIDAATVRRHLYADVQRSMPTLNRLLLLRSIVAARQLNRGLRQLTAVRGERHISTLHKLDADLVRDRVLDFAYDVARSLDHLTVDTNSLTLARVKTRLTHLDRTIARATNTQMYEHAAAMSRDLDADLVALFRETADRSNSVDRVLGVDLERAEQISGRPNADLDSDLERGLDELTGAALGDAFARLLSQTATTIRDTMFAQTLVEGMTLRASGYVIAPESLADKLRHSTNALAALARRNVLSSAWLETTSSALLEIGLPLFERRIAATEQTATAVRLAAACLAVEADAHSARAPAAEYYEIAAGTTLLERRHTGETVGSEAILVALS